MKKILSLALPLVLLAGCADYYGAQNGSNPAFKDKLHVDNPQLYTEISLRDVRQQRNADLLVVQLTVHHESMMSGRYRYRVEWLDGNGFAIDNNAVAWLPVTLGANQDYVIQATSPTAAAQNFRLVFAAQ